MTRILLAITGTIVGLVTLLSFKSNSVPAGSPHGLPAATLSGAATGRATGSSGTGTSTTTAAPPKPGSTAPKTSSAPKTRTIAGQAIQTRYGIVQVQLVVSGKTIQKASFLQLTADDPRSAEINSQAGPILLQETLSAQSATIDTVSGATYTTDGYVQSLQSALDQAGIQ